jgi:hypothetical protein
MANIPSVTVKYVQGKVEKLYEDFIHLHKQLRSKEKKAWFMTKLETFVSNLPELFDLFPLEKHISGAIARCGVPYGKEEQSLYSDQKDKVFEMTIGALDSKWSKIQAKRLERQRQDEVRAQREVERVLEETVASTSQINDVIGVKAEIDVQQTSSRYRASDTKSHHDA